MQIDYEGLQVAYLDESGRIEYYLDTETGEVIEVRTESSGSVVGARFLRVPNRTEESESDDREAFLFGIEDEEIRQQLAASAGDAAAFRTILASDRIIERAWYAFKNDRATAAIEEWLDRLGVR